MKYQLSKLVRRFIADRNSYTINYVTRNFDVDKRLRTIKPDTSD